jgi:hypothetical protein
MIDGCGTSGGGPLPMILLLRDEDELNLHANIPIT